MLVGYEDNAFISEFTNTAIYASARLGDDGAEWGMAEQGIGSSSPVLWTFQEWDLNTDDGIQSGLVGFQLHVVTNGSSASVTWMIGNKTLTYVTDLDSVGDVVLQAGAATSGVAFQFAEVQIAYLDNGQITESAVLQQTVCANTLEDGWEEEQLAVVDVEAGHQELIVAGKLSVNVAEGAWVSGDQLFGNILVMAG